MNALTKGQNKRMSLLENQEILIKQAQFFKVHTCISDIPVVQHQIILCIPFVYVSFVLHE